MRHMHSVGPYIRRMQIVDWLAVFAHTAAPAAGNDVRNPSSAMANEVSNDVCTFRRRREPRSWSGSGRVPHVACEFLVPYRPQAASITVHAVKQTALPRTREAQD